MSNPIRVIAIASGGGHWVQLLRLRKAWDGCAVTYVTTDASFRDEVEEDATLRNQSKPQFETIVEGNRWQKFRLVRQLFKLVIVFIRVRPHVVITTGAAPGYFAIRIAKFFGTRAAWIDSIANSEELSLSGKLAGPFVDVWLTQWEDLASVDGPFYHGSVV